jgi:hypothetical protein
VLGYSWPSVSCHDRLVAASGRRQGCLRQLIRAATSAQRKRWALGASHRQCLGDNPLLCNTPIQEVAKGMTCNCGAPLWQLLPGLSCATWDVACVNNVGCVHPIVRWWQLVVGSADDRRHCPRQRRHLSRRRWHAQTAQGRQDGGIVRVGASCAARWCRACAMLCCAAGRTCTLPWPWLLLAEVAAL